MSARPEVERRIADQIWREKIESRMQAGDERMNQLDGDIKENTRITAEIKQDTAELIEAFQSVKGAFRVLEMIAGLARPLSYIVMLGTAVAGFWYAIKGGGK